MAGSKKKGGAPGWMTTFADLMALLTTFFVLLLSFSQIDAQKWRMIAGSMERAFGVDFLRVDSSPPPKSIIGVEKPPITPPGTGAEKPQKPSPAPTPPQDVMLERMQQALREEIDNDLLSIGRNADGELVISFRHEAAFESGSAVLVGQYRRIIGKIAQLLSQTEGTIMVAGHTDNVPIRTPRFRSNWDLSTARAVSVVHQLLERGALEPDRMIAEGYADTEPLVPNDSPENRARNRRVEVRLRDAYFREGGGAGEATGEEENNGRG